MDIHERSIDDAVRLASNINKESAEILALTALAIGTIATSTCNTLVVFHILSIIKEKTQKEELSQDTWYRMLALGLALPYLCQQDAVIPTIDALKSTISDDSKDVDFRDYTITLLEALAYCGTGNVLKVQKFLHICSESAEKKSEEDKKDDAKTLSPGMPSLANKDKDGKEADKPAESTDKSESKDKDSKDSKDAEKKDASSSKKDNKKDEDKPRATFSKHQAAILGISLISMNEDVGSDMTMRVLGSLLRYGEPVIRKTVPLAFAMLSISNPKLSVLDALSKLSHDNDIEVAQNATFAMGLVASGTNNARLAQQLRNLAQYYGKDAPTLFLVKLTQGLVHMGKGTMTMQPYQGDRTLLNNVSMAGIITTLVAFGDAKHLLLNEKNAHYLLYSLFLAVQPRMLLTFDEDLKPVNVSVRVGQAVDTVGQAGRPKTITGFQTRTTPVLLGYGERAELATDEYLSLTPVLEGHVILKKNPDYDESANLWNEKIG